MAIKLKRTGDGGYTYPSNDGGQWHVEKRHDHWVVFYRDQRGWTGKINAYSRLFQVRTYIEMEETEAHWADQNV